jgi:hypothetical protein
MDFSPRPIVLSGSDVQLSPVHKDLKREKLEADAHIHLVLNYGYV